MDISYVKPANHCVLIIHQHLLCFNDGQLIALHYYVDVIIFNTSRSFPLYPIKILIKTQTSEAKEILIKPIVLYLKMFMVY